MRSVVQYKGQGRRTPTWQRCRVRLRTRVTGPHAQKSTAQQSVMSTGLRAHSEVRLAGSGRWSASEDGKTRERARSGAPGRACACCPQDAERNWEDAMHVPSAREESLRAGYEVIVACETTHVDATGSWQQGGHRRDNRPDSWPGMHAACEGQVAGRRTTAFKWRALRSP